MSGFNIEETLVSCPYDPVHQIRLCKMQFHLTKCAKNFPDVKLESCPFYYSHKFRPENRKEHLENCEYRQNFDDFLQERKNADKYEPKVIVNRACHETENWDDSYSVSYNPQKHLESNPIRRKMMVEPKSKKKQFRREEELRYRKVMEDLEALTVSDEPFTKNNGKLATGTESRLNKRTNENGTSVTKKGVSFSTKDDDTYDDVDDTASDTATATETQSTITTLTDTTATTSLKNNYGKQRKMVLAANFNLANSATKSQSKESQETFPQKPKPSI